MLIPLGVDVPMDRTPWVNYLLIAAIVLISLAAFIDHDFAQTVFDVPLGNTTLHVGLIHLIGNMLFLWVFGNAMNYKFGHLGYLGFYIAVAGVAQLAHFVFDGRPCVGASGAVNGVMGAFLVYFPRNNITMFWWFYRHTNTFYLSSGWLLLFYVGWDIFTIATSTAGNVAVWAHIGGFVTGLGIALICLTTGLVRTSPDEESILHVLGIRKDN